MAEKANPEVTSEITQEATQEATIAAESTQLSQDIILHKAGFIECLHEINNFMSQTGSTAEDALRTRLITHLTSNLDCDRKSDMSDKRLISECSGSGLEVDGLEGVQEGESEGSRGLEPDKT